MKRSKTADGRPLYLLDRKRYVIPGDIHFPIHDEEALKVTLLPRFQGHTLLLQGDTFDTEPFGRFTKNPERIIKSTSIKKERECASRWLDKWLNLYEEILIFPGNHEARCQRFANENLGTVESGWWWPYGSLFADSRITLGEVNYVATLSNIVIEHGDKKKGISGKTPAASVAEYIKDGKIHIFGHSHKASQVKFTSYSGGKKIVTTAINVGTFCSTKKQNYVNQPNWQAGIVVIGEENVCLEDL